MLDRGCNDVPTLASSTQSEDNTLDLSENGSLEDSVNHEYNKKYAEFLQNENKAEDYMRKFDMKDEKIRYLLGNFKIPRAIMSAVNEEFDPLTYEAAYRVFKNTNGHDLSGYDREY